MGRRGHGCAAGVQSRVAAAEVAHWLAAGGVRPYALPVRSAWLPVCLDTAVRSVGFRDLKHLSPNLRGILFHCFFFS